MDYVHDVIFVKVFVENYMKMKEIGARGRTSLVLGCGSATG